MARQHVGERMRGAAAKKSRLSKKELVLATSILIVAVFVVIIIAGVVKELFGSLASQPTPAQIVAARAAVASALTARGENVSNYAFSVAAKVRRVAWNGYARDVLMVTLTNASTRQAYLVDVDSGTILLRAELDTFGSNGTDANVCEELNPCRLRGDND